jgi:16S rRNA (cytosine1402-N4)-methyltransferase
MKSDMSEHFHTPVMTKEVLHYMNVVRDAGTFCDCTVGGAGHLMEMLKTTEKAFFIGIDCDPEAIAHAHTAISCHHDRCLLVEENFTNLGLILSRNRVLQVNGVLFDLGVSYHQISHGRRGFSFEHDGPLSMTMSPSSVSLTEKLNAATAPEICTVLRTYGDVRNYRKIGKALYEHRRSLKTTFDLRKLIEVLVPRRYVKKNLQKVFQALRIWVNDELNSLMYALQSAYEHLSVGGRIVVISYHSGEDRIVKTVFRALCNARVLRVLNKKVIVPDDQEIADNPRSRSAKLRAGEKCVA